MTGTFGSHCPWRRLGGRPWATSYDWHGARLLAILLLHGLAPLLLPSYLAVRFSRGPTMRGVLRSLLLLAWVGLLLLQSLIQSFDVRSWTVQLDGVLLALAVLLPHWKAQAQARPLTALVARMNTLTSLQELIEQAPERASRMVDLLAEHFDLLRAHSQCESVTLRRGVG